MQTHPRILTYLKLTPGVCSRADLPPPMFSGEVTLIPAEKNALTTDSSLHLQGIPAASQEVTESSEYSGCPSTSHLPESPMPVGAGSFKMDWLVLSHITLGMKLLMARPDYSSNIPTLCQINSVDVTSFAEDRKPLQSCNQQPSLVPGHSTYPGVIKASFHASAHLG